MAVNETLGFANLPNQVHRKAQKKGFEFTLMVVGETGLGKSTLVNSLFRADLYKDRKIRTLEQLLNAKVEMTTNTVDIEERGVKLRLTVVDTPGYGDGLDSSQCCDPILNYVDEQYEKFFQHENGLNRRQLSDSRIHCCFYFISPIGYSLKPLDVYFMKLLHKKVNIIPLIAKADTLTRQEVSEMKKRILQDIAANEITVYTVPDCDPDEDHDFKQQITELKAAIPFAVSSSTESHEVKGKSVLGRAYPWGIFETENPDHSDFVKLRSLLVTHMQDLREVTQEVHYENYRSQRIVNNSGNLHNASFDTTLDNAGDNYESDRKLKEKEAEIKRMQLQMAEMQAQLKQQQQPAPHHANGVENGSNGHSK